jgi:hypothetical protein
MDAGESLLRNKAAGVERQNEFLRTINDASSGPGNAIASTASAANSPELSETAANAFPLHATSAPLDAIYASAEVESGENAKSAGPGLASREASTFPCASNAASDESVFSKPNDPENAAVTTVPVTAGPRMKLPASPYAGRSARAPSKTNPSWGGAMAGCAQPHADTRSRAVISFIMGAPPIAPLVARQ